MRSVFLLAVLTVATACTTPEASPDGLDLLFSDQLAVIDLTHAVSAETPWWPGPDVSPFVHDTLGAHPDGAPSFAAYAVPEHFGTHLDAPVHFGEGLNSVDRIPTERFFGPAVVIDVTTASTADPDYALTRADIEDWEARHGRIPDDAIVLLRSGWALKWAQGDPYYNRDPEGLMHFPGFAPEAARFLVAERSVAGIGSDTGSVDPGVASAFIVHEIANGAGLFHLENVGDLTDVPESGAYLIVAPIKIEGGSGGQVRLFAVIR